MSADRWCPCAHAGANARCSHCWARADKPSLIPSGDHLCTCGPAYRIGGETWAYSSFYGWHNPDEPHAALWPVSDQ